MISSDVDYDGYLGRMLKQGQWGGHVELQAYAEMTQRYIVLYGQNDEIKTVGPQHGLALNDEPLRLYFHGNHYQPIVKKGNHITHTHMPLFSSISYTIFTATPPPPEIASADNGGDVANGGIKSYKWKTKMPTKNDPNADDSDSIDIFDGSDDELDNDGGK